MVAVRIPIVGGEERWEVGDDVPSGKAVSWMEPEVEDPGEEVGARAFVEAVDPLERRNVVAFRLVPAWISPAILKWFPAWVQARS